jgi:hypothetical protein
MSAIETASARARDVLDNAVAGEVPNVHAESKIRLGLHGQVPSALPNLNVAIVVPPFLSMSRRSPSLQWAGRSPVHAK